MALTPRTYLIGVTGIDRKGLGKYLRDTDQLDFLESMSAADNLSDSEILCSFYAKLCYRSLVLGKNANVSRIRDIPDNIRGCLDMGHGAVFEHCWLNWVTTNCSRVFTHELVRHRVGTAYSQTSGRYCTVEDAEIVLPPELEEHREDFESQLDRLKDFVARKREQMRVDERPMAERKRITSALRRIMPNGQTNEIGWSCNIRSLRHLIELRTSRHAEWEIRHVFNEVAEIIQERWPLMLYGAEREEVGGLMEYRNLRV